jgi:hypothetical protein
MLPDVTPRSPNESEAGVYNDGGVMGTPSGREYYLVRSLHLRRTEFSAHIVRIETGVGGIWPFNGALCCSYFVLADYG